MEADRQLILIIQESGREHLDDSAIRDLLAELVMPLSDWDIYPVPQDASLRFEFERTDEWKLILGLGLIGAGFFAKSFCQELGKQLAQKLIRHLFLDGKGSITLARDKDSPSAPASPALVEEDDPKSIEKIEEALGIFQMANVDKIMMTRIISVHTGLIALRTATPV